MRIIFACDHAGFELKETLKEYMGDTGYEVEDVGAYTLEPEDDYPGYIVAAAKRVSKDSTETRAVVVGGSGQGEAIVANRFHGVRAVVYAGPLCGAQDSDLDMVTLTREHNDANVLSLGARFLSHETAKEALTTWITTSFSHAERHVRRNAQIDELSPC